ncbi:tryptophan 2,3-dioxygenase [bacterium]|nr:tryptophan 2,3-dioxygenase [bacterium]
MSTERFNYSSYLKIPELLSIQHPVSFKTNQPAHDEMLFVTVHQVFELWMKQIIFEFDSVVSMFQSNFIDERNIGIAYARLNRISEIQKLFIQQIEVLETMTPLDFLDFANLLVGASGFQSFQFRLIEAKLGLKRSERLLYNNRPVDADLVEGERKQIADAESAPTLFTVIETWLERMPFIKSKDYSFVDAFAQATKSLVEQEMCEIQKCAGYEKEIRLKRITEINRQFATVLDENAHNQEVTAGNRKFSYRAMLAALFISLYRDEPIVHLPFKVLEAVSRIDGELAHWRYRHALMVMRMVGSKPGTGGSSGYDYLIKTIEAHRVFKDLMSITTLFIPRSQLPKLPATIERSLGFIYTYEQ